jgi:hypothetical protein
MAKKNKRRKKDKLDLDDDEFDDRSYLKEGTVRIIYAIIFFIGALVLILSAIDKAGSVGIYIYKILSMLLGIGYYLVPILLLVLGILFVKSMKQTVAWPKIVASVFFLISALGIISILLKDSLGMGRGGLLGTLISSPLIHFFDFWVSLLILFGILIISIIVILDPHLSWGLLAVWRKKDEEDEEIEPMIAAEEAPLRPEPVKPEHQPIIAQSEDERQTRRWRYQSQCQYH